MNSSFANVTIGEGALTRAVEEYNAFFNCTTIENPSEEDVVITFVVIGVIVLPITFFAVVTLQDMEVDMDDAGSRIVLGNFLLYLVSFMDATVDLLVLTHLIFGKIGGTVLSILLVVDVIKMLVRIVLGDAKHILDIVAGATLLSTGIWELQLFGSLEIILSVLVYASGEMRYVAAPVCTAVLYWASSYLYLKFEYETGGGTPEQIVVSAYTLFWVAALPNLCLSGFTASAFLTQVFSQVCFSRVDKILIMIDLACALCAMAVPVVFILLFVIVSYIAAGVALVGDG